MMSSLSTCMSGIGSFCQGDKLMVYVAPPAVSCIFTLLVLVNRCWSDAVPFATRFSWTFFLLACSVKPPANSIASSTVVGCQRTPAPGDLTSPKTPYVGVHSQILTVTVIL